jgi:hypothetical protein
MISLPLLDDAQNRRAVFAARGFIEKSEDLF